MENPPPTGPIENRQLARIKSFNLSSDKESHHRQTSLDIVKETPLNGSAVDERPQSMPMGGRTSSVHGLGPSSGHSTTQLNGGLPSANGHIVINAKNGEPLDPSKLHHHSSVHLGSSLQSAAAAFVATNIVINGGDCDDQSETKVPSSGTYFIDGKRQVDFVLVYEQGLHKMATTTDQNQARVHRFIDKDQQRAFFERNLIESGLNLEEDAHLYESHRSRAPSRNHSPTIPGRTANGHGGGGNGGLVTVDAPSPSPRHNNLRSTTFVKIHAPFDVLCAQAEKLNLKMPLRMSDPFLDESVLDIEKIEGDEAENVFVQLSRYWKKLRRIFYKRTGLTVVTDTTCTEAGTSNGHAVNGGGVLNGTTKTRATNDPAKEAYKKQSRRITWSFSRKRIELFDLGDNPPYTFFTPTQRLEIVWNMLQQARNDPEDEKRRGIERLLDTGVYEKAFALHDGDCGHHQRPRSDGEPIDYSCQREKLRQTWGNWRSAFNRQPLHLIRSYYGEKAGFYFAFLGFYTKMLIFPAIIGLCSFLYGMWNKTEDVIVKDICDGGNAPGNYIMCPLCQPPDCHFTQLSDGCENAKWDYRMDNEATLLVACLTVVWSICMLKMWKRREAELAYEWDTYDVEQEDVVVRPEYEERAPDKRRNPVTREMEPYVPPVTKVGWMLASCCITLLVLCLDGAALALLVMARIALYGFFQPYVTENVECSRWFVHGLIFIVVFIFEKVYHRLAHKLTSLECPRTQESWLSSFLWKVFIVELLNDFVPIAYAAWVKGKIIQTPLDLDWHSELCDTGGCTWFWAWIVGYPEGLAPSMGEVTELTAVLLLMRMVVGNAGEIAFPFAKNVYKRFVEQRQEVGQHAIPAGIQHTHTAHLGTFDREPKKTRWHLDYLLNDPELDGVAEEYMEMMIQFAFCTLFVPAFPLAPLVCLLNNILEIRVDAINFVKTTRRLIPIRVAGIQIWNQFLSIISKLAIICNAGLIAFTSTIVPRLYYKHVFSKQGTYENYTLFSISKIHGSAWAKEEVKTAFDHHNYTECWYEDYRTDRAPYDRVQHWWEVMCVRLAVFSAFALLGFTFEWLFNFIVDDTPARVTLTIQRRRYFVTKAIEAHEENKEKSKAGISQLVDTTRRESAFGHIPA